MSEVIRFRGVPFHRCHVCFHFRRDNVYSPWETIGVYYTHPNYQGARYLEEYLDIEDEFYKLLHKTHSEYIRGGPEFLDAWRKQYRSPNDVISPIINYYTSYAGEYKHLLIKLFTDYVGECTSKRFRMLTIMLKMRERYFPVIFNHTKTDRQEVAQQLFDEGHLCLSKN